MKNKNVIKLCFVLLLSSALGVGALLGLAKKNPKPVSADYTSESSLPTAIDLNDTSAVNIRSYYSSLNSLSQNERKGTNLLKNLKTILKNGQKYYSYDSGNFIWQIYEIADRDWDRSPASAITYGTYNSSTNKITNYVYGSNSNPKNDPYVHSLYTNRNVTNEAKAWGDHTQTNWGINREHVWPKAEGFENSTDGGARGDPMHLMSGNGYANNIHSNYFYGYVDKTSSYTDCGSTYSYTSGNLLGYSKTLGGSTNVFEPQDSDKGDIARAIFYMAARYNYFSGSDSDGIDSSNPNLALTQSLSDFSRSAFESTTTTKGYMGILSDLLAWHHADPVDSYEIHRNNLLYKNYTNNRNPFIDFPEWADFIWGSVVYNGSTYQSYSSTPTGYATPSSDTINGYNSGSQEATSITASTSKTYYVGETIANSDITVVDNYNRVITNFTFSGNGYQFTYDDAPSGGNNGTKRFQITYNGLSCNLDVNVARKAYSTPVDSTTTLSSSEFYASNISKSYSTASPENVEIAGTSFTVTTNAYLYYTGSGSNKIYHLSFGKNTGSIKTGPFANELTSVSVVQMSSSRQDGVLTISKNGSTWVSYSETEIAKGSYYYFKFEYTTSSSSYSNIDSITFSLKGNETPSNLANYIMFEDTNNQCTTKFAVAKSYFESMTSDGRSSFMTSNDYVLSNARTRLQAWGTYLGKEISYVNGDYVVSDSRQISHINEKKDNTVLIIIVACTLSISSAALCVILKHRKQVR